MNNDVFYITDISHQEGSITAVLTLNTASAIMKGHFPDQPVVPGACLVQTVKDVLEDVLNVNVMLNNAANIKFISMITPASGPISHLAINYKTADEDNVAVTAQVTANNITCFKLQGKFIKL